MEILGKTPLNRQQLKGLAIMAGMMSLFLGAAVYHSPPDLGAAEGKLFVYKTTGETDSTYRVYFQETTPEYWKGVIVSPRSQDGDSFRFRKFRVNRSSLRMEASSVMTADEYRQGDFSYSTDLSGRDITPLYIPFLQAELGDVNQVFRDGRADIGGKFFSMGLRAEEISFQGRKAYNVTITGSSMYAQSILAAKKRPHMLLEVEWEDQGMRLSEVRREDFSLSRFSN